MYASARMRSEGSISLPRAAGVTLVGDVRTARVLKMVNHAQTAFQVEEEHAQNEARQP